MYRHTFRYRTPLFRAAMKKSLDAKIRSFLLRFGSCDQQNGGEDPSFGGFRKAWAFNTVVLGEYYDVNDTLHNGDT
jgi:hypothetical protein